MSKRNSSKTRHNHDFQGIPSDEEDNDEIDENYDDKKEIRPSKTKNSKKLKSDKLEIIKDVPPSDISLNEIQEKNQKLENYLNIKIYLVPSKVLLKKLYQNNQNGNLKN